MTGWVTADRVQLELEQARCLVFPSLWYETSVWSWPKPPRAACLRSSATSRRRRSAWPMVSPAGFSAAATWRIWYAACSARRTALMSRPRVRQPMRFWADPHDAQHHVRDLLAIYDAVLARARGAENTQACWRAEQQRGFGRDGRSSRSFRWDASPGTAASAPPVPAAFTFRRSRALPNQHTAWLSRISGRSSR